MRTVLLTGATGFVGAQLAYELLARTEVRVVCLARAAGDAQARHRVVRALRERGLWRPGWGHRLVGVAGALDRPRLGLTPARWEQLAVEVDAVLHAGALVNFLYDYRTHRGANVLGTTELLRLAQHGRPVPLHHVSTLGVLDREAALHDAPLAEDVDPERVRPPETGYSRSKWVAERLLARAREAGATVTVLRLGEVMPAAAGTGEPAGADPPAADRVRAPAGLPGRGAAVGLHAGGLGRPGHRGRAARPQPPRAATCTCCTRSRSA